VQAAAPATSKSQPGQDSGKVSLSELPIDSVADIASATSGVDAASDSVPLPAVTALPDAGTPLPIGLPLAAQVPVASAVADLATASANAVAPSGGAVPVPLSADLNLQAATAQTVQAAGSLAVPATTNTFAVSHGAPGTKSDADTQVQTIGQDNSGNAQASGGHAQGAGADTASNQSQNEDVIRMIAEHTEKVALKTASENVTVHLQTDDDTNLSMTVKSAHGEVQAQFMTNNEGLRNALHSNQTQLAQTLETKGMNLGQVSVGLNNSSSRQDQQAPKPNQGTSSRISAPTQAKATSTATFGTPDKGVDLWI
jgi:hypothetical protein